MKATDFVIALVQASLIGAAMTMSYWVKVPWPVMAGMALLGVSALAGGLPQRPAWFEKCGAAIGAASSLVILVSLVCFPQGASSTCLDFYYPMVFWLLAGSLLPSGWLRKSVPPASRWKLLALAWAWAGWGLWIATAYMRNERAAFYAGLGLSCFLLVACEVTFRLPMLAIQAANTLILLFIGLPLVDLAMHPGYALPPGSGALQKYRKYYSYAAAKHDRAAFEIWWNYFYWDQYKTLEKQLFMRDPGPLRFRFRPNSHGTLVRSAISINSRGFRGREIPADKGNTYRIVTLGESTTFGFTIDPDDKPWPEILEQIIRDRLHPKRPVEVINAGIPGADQLYSLRRMKAEILPLKPDMLICYHGINGFHLLDRGMPSAQGRPPLYQSRPLQLLADCEYRVKLLEYGRNLSAQLLNQPSAATNLMETDCANVYRQLIQVAETNSIRFVLGNFSMAVNDSSPADLVEFFRPRFPNVCHAIRNNDAHSQLVEELAREYPDVCFVNTHPGLDGVEEKYLDLVHFCHAGDQQLAENFFAGIRKVLEQDLARPARE